MSEVDVTGASGRSQADEPPDGPARSRRSRSRQGDKNVGIFLVVLVVVIAAWQWIGTSGLVNPLFTGSPLGVVQAYGEWFGGDGAGWADVRATLSELGLGFGLAILIGVPLGIVIGWYRTLNAVTGPFIDFFYAMPHVALVPIIIIWFGIGSPSKVVLVLASAIFPIIMNTLSAVRTTDRELLTLGQSLMATTPQLMRTVVLPAAVPEIVTGIRLGLGKALVAVIVAEMFAGSVGVGYEIRVAGNTFQTDTVLAGIFLTAVAGVLGSLLLSYVGRYFDRWRPAPAE